MKTNIPSSIVSGATIEFIKDLTVKNSHYTPDLWDLAYHIVGAARLDVEAIAWTEDPTKYFISLVAESDDGPLPAGQYFFQAHATDVSNTSDKRLVDSGRINVLVDLSNDDLETYDGRSKAELMVEAIDALLAGKALRGDQAGYTIGQRTLTRIPVDQLLEWRKYYAALYAAEVMRIRISKGLSPFENILTEFKLP